MEIFAIDPGNFKSAFCRIDAETLRPLEFDILANDDLRQLILDRHFQENDLAVIERVASYGMAVGREVFETCEWVGRFEEILIRKLYIPPAKLYRIEEKKHICHSQKANDATIRRALIDRFATHDLKNGRGTKVSPDWFYGFKKDIWAAYAVGLTYIETVLARED